MRLPLTLLAAALLAGCATQNQKTARPATAVRATPPPPTPPPATKPSLPDWKDVVNDPAGAAAVLAVPEDVQAHPLPPDVATAPSEKVFRNLLVLDGMTANRVLATMHGMARALDDGCMACHVMGNFPSDQQREKRTARRMLLLAQHLNTAVFHGHVALSCWTCHRGTEHPQPEAENMKQRIAAVAMPSSLPAIPSGAKRADAVYKNLTVLGGLPPDQLVPAMRRISASLGVGCDTCHVPGNWASDAKREKKTARHMVRLVELANAELFGTEHDDDAVACWTCHRGSEHPQRLPPKAQ